MAKNKGKIEGQELAPTEPWRPEYAPQANSSRRHPASTIAAFVLAAGFGLTLSGVLASQAGILPPLGGSNAVKAADKSPDASTDAVADPSSDPAAVVADPSPDASVDPMVDADVDATTDADVDTAPEANGAADPTDAPAVNPDPTSGPVVIPPPAGGGTGDEANDGDNDGEANDDGGAND